MSWFPVPFCQGRGDHHFIREVFISRVENAKPPISAVVFIEKKNACLYLCSWRRGFQLKNEIIKINLFS